MLIQDDDSPLLDGYPIIIPLTIKLYPDKELEIDYYPQMIAIAKQLAGYKNPLCDTALEALYIEAEKFAESVGYECEPKSRKSYIISYFAAEKSEIRAEKIQPTTEKLTEHHQNLKNRTTVDIDELLDYDLTSYLTVKDGEIVSIASVNPFSDGINFELNVQTAVRYRGNGYAASNIAALAIDLLENGCEITYNCRRYNRGSQKTAEAVGLREYGRFYMAACYKK